MGGLDLAAHLAGLHVGVSMDRDCEALGTLHSALGTETVATDSASCNGRQLLARLPEGSDVRYVIGGPPCTAFSHAGFWIEEKRAGADPAASCLDDFGRIVREIRPAAFCLENVPGLTFKTHRERLRSLVARMRRAGYSVSWDILHAADYGVAQARRRLFVVGIRGGPRFSFPWPKPVERTSDWSIGDLGQRSALSEEDEVPGGVWADLLPLVPAGGNYLHFTERNGWKPPIFRWRSRYWSFLLKLSPARPSPTVSAQRVTFNGPFHWENRHLRARELARLQGFPDWFPLSPELTAARRQIGNAVPPPLGAAVLWEIRRHLGEVNGDLPEVLQAAADPARTVHDVMGAMSRPEGAASDGQRISA